MSDCPRWRNRGKLSQEQPRNETAPEPDFDALAPPPPYDAPSHHHHKQDFKVPEPVHVVPISPPSSPKKPRHAQHSRPNKRPVTHRRRKSHRTHPDHHHSFSSSWDPYCPQSSTRSELESDIDQVEDKMDWIGDKLSMLIEQGRRALHTHVVVSSDAKEDEVDDGSDAWEEEHDVNRTSPRQSRSRSGSVRQFKRPKPLNLGAGPSTSSAYHIHHPSSPHFTDLGFPSAPLPTSHSTASLNNISTEDPSTYESPELRESMDRARQRLMSRRLGGT